MKTISNRLKIVIPWIISKNQSAFTPARLITNNIIVGYELFHYMRGHNGTNGAMALKLDMSKAFNRVEWQFLEKIIMKLGFTPS